MKFILNLFYCPANFIANFVYILIHFWKIPAGLKRLHTLRRKKYSLTELNIDLKYLLEYQADADDWRPYILSLCMRNFKDDCDGYAAFAKWVGKKRMKLKTEFWSLFGPEWGHAICLIHRDSEIFIADNYGVRPFISWEKSFPRAKKIIKRWY